MNMPYFLCIIHFVKCKISLHGWEPNNSYSSVHTGCRASCSRYNWGQKKENPSVLRMTKDREKKLNKFKWLSVLTEMEERAPDVVDFLSAVALQNVKADDSQVPRICTAYGVLMNTSYYKMQFQLYFFASLTGQYMLANLAVKNCPNQYEAKI